MYYIFILSCITGKPGTLLMVGRVRGAVAQTRTWVQLEACLCFGASNYELRQLPWATTERIVLHQSNREIHHRLA